LLTGVEALDPGQAFGIAAIAAMVGSYALEGCGRGFVLLFAGRAPP